MIYFDNAATMPMNAKALDDLYSKSKSFFGNPSTSYSIGVKAKRIVNESRNKIASLLNCKATDLFFTSGGTEANNIIIQSIIRNSGYNAHIICSSIEHESILNVLNHFKSDKIEITYIKPNRDGIISPKDIEKNIKENTKLICVQYINNELGTIQPIPEIGKVARKNKIHFHVDAVQAIGHIKIDIEKLNADSISASAHKFGGPKGIGFLYTNNHSVGLCYGGGQEKGVKSGTENVPSISAMSIALEDALINIEDKKNKISNMVNLLKEELSKNERITLNVNNTNYSSIISLRIKGVSNEAMINYLDINDICVSTGSACSGNSFERSHVLKSIELTDDEIDTTLRISLSINNTSEECQEFIKKLLEGIEILAK